MSVQSMRPILCLFACLFLLRAAPPAPAQETGPTVMPISELRRGMQGYGLTALTKREPERFDVEVLGVIRGWNPKGDMILIRMSGPVINQSGGFSGMSGSPVYVDGKLIGAVAYGWSFVEIPLAGVTPIEEMLKVSKLASQDERKRHPYDRAMAWARLSQGFKELAELASASRPADLRRAALRAMLPPMMQPDRLLPSDALPDSLTELVPAGATAPMRPFQIPLSVQGVGQPGPLRPLLEGTPFVPVQTVDEGAGPDPPQEVSLVPGVPLGVAFVTGDMTISGMGTLTHVQGGHVLALGHPMFGAGEVDLPLALGYDPIVVPSAQSSFRMTNTGPVIGRVTQDRDSGIHGEIGAEAPTFPCTVRVTGSAADEYEYRVAGYWQTAPMFAFYAIALSSSRWQGSGMPYHLRARAQIRLSGRQQPVLLENDYSAYSVLDPSFELVMLPLTLLTTNPFRETEIAGLDFEVDVREGLAAAYIDAVSLDRPRARPGSKVTLFVRLRQHRGDIHVRKATITVPQTAEPGTEAKLLVADAASSRMIDRELDPGFFEPTDFEHLVALLEHMESNRNLVVRASFVDRGLRYEGQPMPALPESAFSVMQFNRHDGQARPLVRDVRQSIETPWVLSGARVVTLSIEEPAVPEP